MFEQKKSLQIVLLYLCCLCIADTDCMTGRWDNARFWNPTKKFEGYIFGMKIWLQDENASKGARHDKVAFNILWFVTLFRLVNNVNALLSLQ